VVENEIVPFELLGEVYFRNTAKTNRKGVEFGTQVELVRDLTITVSYTYSHFTYNNYEARSIVIDSLGNFVTSNRNFSGNVVPSVPENNVYLALAYSIPVYYNIHVFAKMSYVGISGMWVDDTNSDKTDAYNILNSVLGFDLRFDNFNILLSGGINNMLDEVYVGFTNTNSTNGRFYEAGAPRNYFGSVNVGYTF